MWAVLITCSFVWFTEMLIVFVNFLMLKTLAIWILYNNTMLNNIRYLNK